MAHVGQKLTGLNLWHSGSDYIIICHGLLVNYASKYLKKSSIYEFCKFYVSRIRHVIMTSFPVKNDLVPISPGQFWKLDTLGDLNLKFQPFPKKRRKPSDFLDLDLYYMII